MIGTGVARILALLCLALLTKLAAASPAVAGAASTTIESVGVPDGFDELTRDRELLVDLYFGGRKLGEARVISGAGNIRFKEPKQILALVPHVVISTEVANAFASEFPTNAALVCSDGDARGCGQLSPKVAGIIFDEDRFRVDLFMNRKWLGLLRPEEDIYLPTPTAPLSLTSSTGLALSGSNGSSPAYNLQNRTVVGFHNARIRSESSYASHYGFVMDTLVGEVDRPGMRYSAGLFWAPGLDLTGQRRIAGVGVSTQFDTRADRDTLEGSPLILFVGQPARVDILVDGRLVSSGVYEAGNNVLDTSSLPSGSYEVVLRIHEGSGAVRDEHRFFAKNPQIAPIGQPIYFGYAGFLANTVERRPLSISKDIYYQIGMARRLSEKIAIDVSAIGTEHNPILEAGAWLMAPVGRIRAAALASPRGDRGGLLQVASSQLGRFNLNFDLRRVWSHDGKPLIPISNSIATFDSLPSDAQFAEGSFTQASGSVGYRFGNAYVSVIGSLRKDRGAPADYSIGPNVSWPIVNAHGLQIALQADAQETRTSTAGYVGVRMLFNRAGYSVTNSFGGRTLSNKNAEGRARAVGDTTAHFAYSDDEGTDLSLASGLTRELDSTTAHAESIVYSRFGSARGEVLHSVEGSKRTQYGINIQTGTVLTRSDVIVGGRELAESGLLASIEGNAGRSQFEVLVDGQPRGRLRAGERLPIFLQAYRAYSIVLRAVDAASVWYDAAPRKVTLFPGNVEHVRWRVEHVLTVFGRAVRPDGKPVADASITSRRGLGQSNADGYFQIDTTGDDVIAFADASGGGCKVALGALKSSGDFARVGKVVCQ